MYFPSLTLAVDTIAKKAVLLPSSVAKGIAMTRKEENSGLTAEWLRENMDYDQHTGIFSWKKGGVGRVVGRRIGANERVTRTKNYRSLRINGKLYYAHRVPWFYVYGQWPSTSIDHIDGDRTNNAMINLRLATPAQNAARRVTHRALAPSRGVFPQGVGFVARLHHGGKRHYLGYFPTAEAAKVAYEAKAKEIHGDFAYSERKRADFVNAIACEICGKTSDLRLDRTALGKPRGKLCLHCWGLIQSCNMDKRLLQRAMRYIDDINVFDEPNYQEFIGSLPQHQEPN